MPPQLRMVIMSADGGVLSLGRAGFRTSDRGIFKTGLTEFTGLCLPAHAGFFWIYFVGDCL